MKFVICAVVLMLVAACNRAETPQAPTAAERGRLNDADAMLDNLAANEKGPATEVADPSNSSQ